MTKPDKQKIVVYGLFGQRNWGNEGTLMAGLVNIKKFRDDNGLEIICVCTDPEDVIEKYGIVSFPIQCPAVSFLDGREDLVSKFIRKVFIRIPAEIIHWIKAMKAIWGSKVMIAPGTGLLNDYATSAFGRPYDILMWTLLSKLCACKIFFVSVGAGPIRSKMSGFFIKMAMRVSDYRSFRDEYSRDYVKKIGFNSSNDPIYPDLAFSLPMSMFAVEEKKAMNGNVIGVGLKDYYGEEGMRHKGQDVYTKYLHKMVQFVVWLIKRNYTVRLLVGDSLYDEPVKNDLLVLLAEYDMMLDKQNILFESVANVEELLSQISEVDLVISPRFHNIIYGLMLNKPVISLSYHQKFAPLMDDLGLSDYCQDLGQLDIDMLIYQFEKLKENNEDIMMDVAKKKVQYSAKAQEQYSYIFNM
jgi:polysaccharide pyruvyl transferase WcaK-like protein